MRKKTIMKAVILTATILALTGCNSSTGANTTTEPVTTTTVEQEVETSTEETTTTATSPDQEIETSSTSTKQGEETTTATTTGSDESTIPETTVEIETTTQVAGYDGICSEYGHAETINRADCFILDEGAPLAAWKDALSKHRWVSDDSVYFYTTMEYRGHTVLTGEPGMGFDNVDENARDYSDAYLGLLGYAGGSPFTYDLDLNIVCADSDWTGEYWTPSIIDKEVRDGITWYKYDWGDDDAYWLPEHNGADWEQVYKKYVEEPMEARWNSLSEEDKVNESLIWDEQVWDKTYYDVRTDGADSGSICVTKQYAYKNADGTITRSNGWENCDSSIFEGTSLLENGSIVNKDINDGVLTYWQMDGDVLYIKRGGDGEYQERASELYYHLIDLYGEECVYWNGDGNIANTSSFDGRHDWDVYGDGKDRCKTKEEHIAKCQGN